MLVPKDALEMKQSHQGAGLGVRTCVLWEQTSPETRETRRVSALRARPGVRTNSSLPVKVRPRGAA